MKGLLKLYLRPATLIVYMLQGTEYQVGPYLRWFWRTQDFSLVMRRRALDQTRRARMLRWLLKLGMALQIIAGLGLLYLGSRPHGPDGGAYFGLALLASYPVVWAHAVVVPLLLARQLIVKPQEARLVAETEKIFAAHSGARIAVLGSYGKTTMKEVLRTVLAESLKVAATPGNKNVSVSHARFAKKLAGDEEALIIEYGEGRPGDIARFARHTHPTHAVITGVAVAHLDQYKTVGRAAGDIFSIKDFVSPGNIYVNGESPAARPFIDAKFRVYTGGGMAGWDVSEAVIGLDGTVFKLRHGNRTMKLHSGLLGRHQVGPLTAASVLALQLGLSPAQIKKGISQTVPFEHRLQPYKLGGAWIIDDTYNGNLEGIRAGTALLAELPAGRKWYITPGLVDQGEETAAVHREAGRLIAAAQPDVVVLMQNSVTQYIREGLESAGFSGELRIEQEPLDFYTHLDQFVAAGDIVLMQNDWTDNYA